MRRRQFFQSSLIAVSMLTTGFSLKRNQKFENFRSLKISLNAYSFNKQLLSGETDLFQLIDFCKKHGFDAIDPTAYYFPGYPEIPNDQFIYDFKRKAFINGLEISGTGIRNDFSNANKSHLEEDLKLFEAWCLVASKLGAPLLRVFPGKEINDNRHKKAVMKQVIGELSKACKIGEKYGVIIALQNHNEFLKTSEEIVEVLNEVNSKWLGLHLDIGSLAARDPYKEIERLVKYAVTWQIKEWVWINNKKSPVDYARLMDIIKSSGYVGYLPLETLNSDPRINLPIMINEVRKQL